MLVVTEASLARGRLLTRWCLVGLITVELVIVAASITRGLPAAVAALGGAAAVGYGCYATYQGANWARWLLLALIVIRAAAVAGSTISAIRGGPPVSLLGSSVFLAAYLAIAVVLSSPLVGAYVMHRRRQRGDA